VQALNRDVNIFLQVRRNCSLELNTVNGGNLEVEGVNGEIDVNRSLRRKLGGTNMDGKRGASPRDRDAPRPEFVVAARLE
jgi:hypothetical protein